MKKIVLFLICAALLAACKKNGSSPKNVYLSKVIVNGHTECEYVLNSQGQLVQEKYYNEHSPYNLMSRYEYTYDNAGKLKESKGYSMPENKLTSHIEYTLNAHGSIGRTVYYSVNGILPGTFSTQIDNEYDAVGRVIKQTWKDEDEKVQTYRNFHYYPNGNMRTYESWQQWGGPAPEKTYVSSIGPSDTTLPASFYTIKAYPVNFYYNYLTGSYIRHFLYDDDGQVSLEYLDEMTARKYNKRGLITQQTVTTTQVKPAGASSEKTMEFEYSEF